MLPGLPGSEISGQRVTWTISSWVICIMFWLETVKASFQLKEKSRNILCFSGLCNVLKRSCKTNTMAPKGNVRKMFLSPHPPES